MFFVLVWYPCLIASIISLMVAYWVAKTQCMSSGFCFIYDVDQYYITKNSDLKKQDSFLEQELKIYQVWWVVQLSSNQKKKPQPVCSLTGLGSTSRQDVAQATKISLIYSAAGSSWGIHLAQIMWYALCNINTANMLQNGTKLHSSSGHWQLRLSLSGDLKIFRSPTKSTSWRFLIPSVIGRFSEAHAQSVAIRFKISPCLW